METFAIYKKGETGIQTTVTNGLCHYTGYLRGLEKDLTVEEYLKEKGPEYVYISMDEAMEHIENAQSAAYVKPWEPITEEQWDTALNELPPEKWESTNEVNIFRCCEYYDGLYTSHYATFRGSYYTGMRKITEKYNKIADEIKATFKEEEITP